MPDPVLIVANKRFEVAPLVGVLTNPESYPQSDVVAGAVQYPPPTTGQVPHLIPRVTGRISQRPFDIWCIEDLTDPNVCGGSHNSSEKARVLELLFAHYRQQDCAPGLVIAFGTAAARHEKEPSQNGCVVVGRSVFLHNPYAQTPSASPSRWGPPDLLDRVIESGFRAEAFADLTADGVLAAIDARLLHPLRHSARHLQVVAAADAVGVSSVNVVDFHDYDHTDRQALDAAKNHGVAEVLSLESTHGIIRAQSDAPFLFVSGITNHFLRFRQENLNFPYTQNFVAAHNAAMALVWLLDWASKSSA